MMRVVRAAVGLVLVGAVGGWGCTPTPPGEGDEDAGKTSSSSGVSGGSSHQDVSGSNGSSGASGGSSGVVTTSSGRPSSGRTSSSLGEPSSGERPSSSEPPSSGERPSSSEPSSSGPGASSGVPPVTCGPAADTCRSNQFCDWDPDSCGASDGLGECRPRPETCTREYAPVCGCDGQTHGNLCMAHAVGVDALHAGPCESAVTCSVPGDAACGSAEFCDFDPDSCGVASATGICRERPRVCGDAYAPVCGCDGRTYASACDAFASGMDVQHEGPCESAVTCGTRGAPPCDRGQFCDFEPDSCGATDVGGTCQQRPQVCPRVYSPVCGCDGRTYGNRCEAHAAGADTQHDGPCESATTCGGRGGTPCADREFCDFEPDSCGAADQPGTCRERPRVCPDVYAPVCACNLATYGNVCEAQAAGVDILHDGPCEQSPACGSRGLPPCPEGQFCDFEPNHCGATDQGGACRVRPQVCPLYLAPVCGCDGVTYGNSCEAYAAGVDLRHDGACAQVQACGSRGLPPCPEGQFCDHEPNSCGATDQGGTCRDRPRVCPDVYNPVCGCDGRTYGNDCEAFAAGVDVRSAGECPGSAACGGRTGLTCPRGEFCDWEPDSCGATDATGTCHARPGVCPLYVDPTCGCDGRTYGNPCEAHAAGVDVSHPGSCEAAPACGSRGLPPCAAGTFCDWDPNSCGAADQPGTCHERPVVCPDLFRPVCGCDGLTYGNACQAAAAGVDVRTEGACQQATSCAAGGRGCGSNQFCDFDPNGCGAGGETGTCRERPQLCPLYLDPVCGCDGRTYGNDCEAFAAGVDVLHRGACASVTACVAGGRGCDSSQFCDFSPNSCGADGASGACHQRPTICPDVYAPVCGCDDRTYGNGCEAAAWGVDVKWDGACASTVACGGRLGNTCGEGQFCDYDPNACGVGGAEGTCRERPQVCPLYYRPVCACDGLTYGNDCEAAAAGQDVSHDGPCSEVVGCSPGGAACGERQFCDHDPNSCGVGGAEGTCRERPATCPRLYAPVCGCDQNTYPNSCQAAVAGVDVAYEGECAGVTRCGGGDGPTCAEAQYCDWEPNSCGRADEVGMCQQRPQVCPLYLAPVCGCDDRTYGNGCQAAAAGVDVQYAGACTAVTSCSPAERCGEREFCDYEPNSCGLANDRGTCRVRPSVCADIFSPVCACDGRTYGNGCEAAAVGQDVMASGYCP